MSMFKVNVVARNTKDESFVSPPTEVLVDAGSELTWLPKDLLIGINITPVRKRSLTTGTKQIVTREIGYAILSAEGVETVDEVVFAESGDTPRIGVKTLAGFGVMVDNIAHRFVATITIVAANREEGPCPNEGRIEAEILAPPSDELKEDFERLFIKHQETCEELKRIGD